MLLQKAIRLLKLMRRNVIRFLSSSQEKHSLSLSPATGIDSHFYWEMEKFVMIALKIPVVSSYFMTLYKSNTVFFKKAPRGERESWVFLVLFNCCIYCNFVFCFIREVVTLLLHSALAEKTTGIFQRWANICNLPIAPPACPPLWAT